LGIRLPGRRPAGPDGPDVQPGADRHCAPGPRDRGGSAPIPDAVPALAHPGLCPVRMRGDRASPRPSSSP